MGRRILVVDDEPIVLESVRKALKKDPYEIEIAESAAEALGKLAAGNYDLVITDLMMPGVDGLRLLERMREIGSEAQTIMMTGYPTIQTGLRAKRLGAFEYVTKPFTRQELRSVLVRALRRRTGSLVSRDPAESRGMFQIPEHSWARVASDGTARVGLTLEFAQSVGEVAGLDLPGPHDFLEQGRVCAEVRAADGVVHSLHAPLSGQVVALNPALAADPGLAGRDPEGAGWLLILAPHKLALELDSLVPL